MLRDLKTFAQALREAHRVMGFRRLCWVYAGLGALVALGVLILYLLVLIGWTLYLIVQLVVMNWA